MRSSIPGRFGLNSIRRHLAAGLGLAALILGTGPLASATPAQPGSARSVPAKHAKKRHKGHAKVQRRAHAVAAQGSVARPRAANERPLVATLTHAASAFGPNQYQAISDSPSILFASTAFGAFQAPAGGGGGGGGGGAPQAASAPRPANPPAGGQRRARFSDRREGLVAVGIVGGGYFRDLYQAFNNTNGTLNDRSGKFLIGGTVQLLPTPRWVVEFDAMRRGFGVENSGNLLGLAFLSSSAGSQWEFPVLVKRRFLLARNVKPFLGAGVAFRYVSVDSTTTALTNAANFNKSSDSATSVGIPLAAGIEFRALIFRFSPEVRYTLWSTDTNFANIHSNAINANANQIALILGFTIN